MFMFPPMIQSFWPEKNILDTLNILFNFAVKSVEPRTKDLHAISCGISSICAYTHIIFESFINYRNKIVI